MTQFLAVLREITLISIKTIQGFYILSILINMLILNLATLISVTLMTAPKVFSDAPQQNFL